LAFSSAVGSKPGEPHDRLRGATNPQGHEWSKPSKLGGTARADLSQVWQPVVSGNRVWIFVIDIGGGAFFEQPHERSPTEPGLPDLGGPRETECVFIRDAWDRMRCRWRQLSAYAHRLVGFQQGKANNPRCTCLEDVRVFVIRSKANSRRPHQNLILCCAIL